jgi:hypothetical protein
MFRHFLPLAALGGLLTSAATAAEPFTIDLTARSGKASQTAHAESAGPLAKPKDRGVIEVKSGERITIKWAMTYADKDKLKDITVHLFVVKEEKIGQKTIPKLNKDVAAESALSMDFGPKDKAEGELNFTIDKEGSYLLRLETIGATAGPAEHETFAALDVKVR